MQAVVGDRLHIRGHTVGDPDRMGEIVEVKGQAGAPPYLVRFDDGRTLLVFPGPDAVIEAGKGRGKGRSRSGGAGGAAAKAGPARKKGSR
ncbi:MAG TPA: DUF1918 domain-containing protein [Streptosporangiaceae bacterium]